jgi:cation diffusion facilitator CzcD-associated flavoprotein CzcO
VSNELESPRPSLVAEYDYCIVGAGPGGLQVGQFMLEKGRNYKIFERQIQAGSFFARFPIHRGLISMNKRNTGRTNPEFNRRHDWNSLLNNDDVPGVRNRTTMRWPKADTLSAYLQDYAVLQEDAGYIAYGTSVNQISRDLGTGRFTLTLLPSALEDDEVWYFDKKYRTADAHRTSTAMSGSVGCGKVVMANGMWVPNKLPMRGIELAEGYESLPATGESFEGTNVAIFGLGNAAFEAANSLNEYANFVHIWPTRVDPATGRANLPTSWESRYIGALRATRTAVLDGYMLNALDALPRGAELTEPPVCVADGALNSGAVWRAQVIVWSQARTE